MYNGPQQRFSVRVAIISILYGLSQCDFGYLLLNTALTY